MSQLVLCVFKEGRWKITRIHAERVGGFNFSKLFGLFQFSLGSLVLWIIKRPFVKNDVEKINKDV